MGLRRPLSAKAVKCWKLRHGEKDLVGAKWVERLGGSVSVRYGERLRFLRRGATDFLIDVPR